MTAEEIAAIDREAIEKFGIPGLLLMENAGSQTVRAIMRRYGSSCVGCAVILCGPGNNGGDGFVVARRLARLGVNVNTFLLGSLPKVKGDALTNLRILESLGLSPAEISSEEHLKDLSCALRRTDLVVDALFGSGLSSPVRDLAARAIEMINASGKPVVAIDVPSGVCGSTGRILGTGIMAQMTVTMGLPKLGLLLFPGARNVGELVVADIGFPRQIFQTKEFRVNLTEPEEVAGWISHRHLDAHKGICGKVLVIAGSTGYTGAAALVAEAALRVGAGLVYLAVPASLNQIMEVKLTEVITVPVADEGLGYFRCDDLSVIEPYLHSVDVLAVGPGVGRRSETKNFLKKLISLTEVPAVVDADALDREILEIPRAGTLILTPHPGEMARIMDTSINRVAEARLDILLECSRHFGATVVLKGSHTLIAESKGRIFINPTGNPGMATGGMGDVLTGAVAGLIGQGMEAEKAAIAGVFFHGLAGDLAASHFGKRGLLASDLLVRLPNAIRLVLEDVKSCREFMHVKEALLDG